MYAIILRREIFLVLLALGSNKGSRFAVVQMAENMRPTLEACTEALHSLLAHVPGYEIEDNKVGQIGVEKY